jgi:chromosome partitioning protein
MILTVASFKGGQSKTTTAVHLAALLNTLRPTLLVDGDPNRSASMWNRRRGFSFKVVDEKQAVRFAREYEHIIIDTQARPTEDDLRQLAEGADLLIVPLTPDALSLDTLFLLTDMLGPDKTLAKVKVLLTIVPPKPVRDGVEVLATLTEAKIPAFKTFIRRFRAYQKAALTGVLVNQVDDSRALDAWADYQALLEELKTLPMLCPPTLPPHPSSPPSFKTAHPTILPLPRPPKKPGND